MSNTEEPGLLNILFKDGDLLVLNKPSGIPVQDDLSGDRSLLASVADTHADRSVRLVHRLDRPVSGCLVVALSERAGVGLDKAFREGRVEKVYWALVHGSPPSVFLLEHELVHDTRRHKARVTETGKGRSVRLKGKVIGEGDRYALVALRPDGGAFHQIRAQMAAFGHPIKGDVKYGARRGEPDRSIGLHARSLGFFHPVNGTKVDVTAPVPNGLWRRLMPSDQDASQGS